MNFTPKTDKEIAEANLIPAGVYDYEVAEASEERSKKGDDMLKLKLRVFVGDSERTVTDYLIGSMPAKLKHFCDSHGFQKLYEAGTLRASDCEMQAGKCKIGVKKDRSGQYPDQSQVVDYVVANGNGRATTTEEAPPWV